MAQLQKGFEYDSSNPAKNIVTDDNLNALVANATLLSGAITEQTANSITADTDIMLLSKAGSLIKQTKAQFTDTINSNIANINTVNAALVDADDVDTVDATLTGNLAVGGNSALTGNLAVSGALTSSGTANFTGTLQYKSTSIYGLYSIQVNPISALVSAGSGSTATTHSTTNVNVRGAGGASWWLTQGHTHYSETIVVPAGELWTVDYSPIELARDTDDLSNFVCLKDEVPFSGTDIQSNGILRYSHFTQQLYYSLSAGTHIFLWKSLILNGSGGDNLYMDINSNCVRKIHKYKTA